jgi:hypothetical protein
MDKYILQKEDVNMKKTTRLLLLFTALLFTVYGVTRVEASTENTVIYFYGPLCSGCAALEADGYIDQITDAGIQIIRINTEETYVTVFPENVIYNQDEQLTVFELWGAFNVIYKTGNNPGTPHMFVGEQELSEYEIRAAIDNGDFFEFAEKELLDVDVEAGLKYDDFKTVAGFFSVVVAGLLDGFNPCAIALLLLFISLLGFTENKKILIIVSTTYIITMFISYFLIGAGVLGALKTIVEGSPISTIVSWVMLFIVLIFFVLNVYDYLVAKNEDYGKIKSQIPKWLQRFNTRIMKVFTSAMEDSEDKGNIIRIILLTFVLGFIMTLTEFTCSGFIYLGVLQGISVVHEAYAYILLLVFNIMFVSPMIVIAFLSVKSRSTMSISNWMRENLHIIKLFNAVVFLLLAVFIILRLLGIVH